MKCASTSARVGQVGACLRCVVDARPPPHAVFWASDTAGTNLAAVAPPTAYWNVIRVRHDGSRGDMWEGVIRKLWDTVCVCARSLSLKGKSSKLSTPNFGRHMLTLGQKVRGQGHRVMKCTADVDLHVDMTAWFLVHLSSDLISSELNSTEVK